MKTLLISASAAFVANVCFADGAAEIAARSMEVASVSRAPNGMISYVDLDFGSGNGLSNRLYVAYGDTCGGDRIGGWENAEFLTYVDDEVSSYRAYVPSGAKAVRFFLDVPFPGGQFGEPVKWITADGSQYIDTGIKLQSGDALKARFRPGEQRMAVMGYRKSSSASDINVNLVMSASKPTAFYSASSAYADYMMTSASACTLNEWYDIVLSPSERSFTSVETGQAHSSKTTVNADEFVSGESCYLFHVAGSPSVSEKTVGSISSFRIERNGSPVASYLPYKIGGVYGFYDRVSGDFFMAAENGTAFTGEDDATLSTPLTSATETLYPSRPTVESAARTITGCTVARDGDHDCIDVTFGENNGFDNPLYLAYGSKDFGTDYTKWPNFVKLGTVGATTNSWRVAVPSEARYCRLSLSLPFEGEGLPVAMKYVTGDGTDCFDTGLKLKGGDEVALTVRPSNVYNQQIFGSRPTSTLASAVTVVISGSRKFIVDYTDSGLEHRCMAEDNAVIGRWYDIVAGPTMRRVSETESGTVLAENTVQCASPFETPDNAYLFGISVNTVVENRFSGDVASLSVKRDGAYELSLCPCVVGSAVGFYDRAAGVFMPVPETGFSASEKAEENPLVSVSEALRVNRKGLLWVLR